MSLTYLGHSAFRYEVGGLRIYSDPYIQEPLDWRRLPKGDVVLLTHGHFDHGILLAPELYEAWQCKFVVPRKLAAWILRKYKGKIPHSAIVAVQAGQTVDVGGVEITAVPANHPMTRLGKTMMAVFARSSAPGNPVLGYYFDGYYQSGDTIYTPEIAAGLSGRKVHTAVLPIGGKYKTATPAEALRIAEEIGSQRIVPCHWQALMEQVPFRYQPSHLVRLVKAQKSKVEVCPLAIGETLEDLVAARDETAIAR